MTPRKTILRELQAAGPDSFVQPSRIQGFESDSAKFRETLNELLKDRLITGSKNEDGDLVVAVNPARAKEVSRALSSPLSSPAFLIGAGIAVAVLVGLVALG
ncbi:MAG: hypothetical protein ACR2QM_13760 [Longimicrobiales bacterium]